MIDEEVRSILDMHKSSAVTAQDHIIAERVIVVKAIWQNQPAAEKAVITRQLAHALKFKKENAVKFEKMQPSAMVRYRHEKYPDLPFFDEPPEEKNQYKNDPARP